MSKAENKGARTVPGPFFSFFSSLWTLSSATTSRLTPTHTENVFLPPHRHTLPFVPNHEYQKRKEKHAAEHCACHEPILPMPPDNQLPPTDQAVSFNNPPQ